MVSLKTISSFVPSSQRMLCVYHFQTSSVLCSYLKDLLSPYFSGSLPQSLMLSLLHSVSIAIGMAVDVFSCHSLTCLSNCFDQLFTLTESRIFSVEFSVVLLKPVIRVLFVKGNDIN